MIPELGRYPREGNVNPLLWTEEPGGLQSIWLQSWTRLSDSHTHTHTHTLLLLEKEEESQNFRDRIKLCKKPVQILHFVKEKTNSKVESDC